MNIIAFFQKAKAKVSALFITLFGKQAAEQFATGAKALLSTAVGVLAQDAVAFVTATSPTLGSTAARDAATAKLSSDASAQGHAITSSVANMLIELAVQFAKGALVASL